MTTSSTIEPTRKDERTYHASDALSHRQTASPLVLIAEAIGGPRAVAGKAVRFVRTLRTVLDRREIRRRIDRLLERGMIDTEPTRQQLVLLGLDMLRYFIEPGARDYYTSRGIHFGMHQILRILDDPSSMMDPVGLLSERDTIIGHLLQVVHANPVYDLQLLEMFEDGLDQLEHQTAAVIEGSHPRSGTVGAVVEDPEYHARLLAYVRAYRKDPRTEELRRRADRARDDEAFVLAEETFGGMPSAFRYASRLPRDLAGAWRHVRTRPRIDPSYCDPDTARRVREDFARSAAQGSGVSVQV